MNSNTRHLIDRIMNDGAAAEGSLLPPLQVGDARVPQVTGLQMLSTKTIPGGTRFTIGWTEPDHRNISGFNVIYSGRDGRQGSQFIAKSPAEINIPVVGGGEPFTFKVQTVLSSGLSSIIDNCPTTAGVTRSGASSGTATLVAGTVTVSTTAVRATSIILLTAQNTSGTAGHVSVSGRNDTSFGISSTSATDTRTIGWFIVEP